MRALATLDHVNIVRYYQAWFECPPIGWQEEQDKCNERHLNITSSSQHLMDSQVHQLDGNMTHYEQQLKQEPRNDYHPSTFNPLKPFSMDESMIDVRARRNTARAGSTEGFDLTEYHDTTESCEKINAQSVFSNKKYTR